MQLTDSLILSREPDPTSPERERLLALLAAALVTKHGKRCHVGGPSVRPLDTAFITYCVAGTEPVDVTYWMREQAAAYHRECAIDPGDCAVVVRPGGKVGFERRVAAGHVPPQATDPLLIELASLCREELRRVPMLPTKQALCFEALTGVSLALQSTGFLEANRSTLERIARQLRPEDERESSAREGGK